MNGKQIKAVVWLFSEALHEVVDLFDSHRRRRRAATSQPDEAVSALDVSVQAQVLKLMEDLRRRFDLAVLFITHDLRVAGQICDRIAVMQGGMVVEQGSTAALFAAPQHAYTKALFESAPERNFRFGEFEQPS